MPRSNIAQRKNIQRQTRLGFKPVSPPNDNSTIDNRNSVSLKSNEISSPFYHVDSDTGSGDFQLSPSKPNQPEKILFKSADRCRMKPRVILRRGIPDELSIQNSLTQDGNKLKSQTFSAAYQTYKENIYGKNINLVGSSDGSEADDDDTHQSYELVKAKLGKTNLCRGSRRNSILSDQIEAISDHPVKNNTEDFPVFASTQAQRRKPSFEACQSHKPKAKTIVIYSSSDDDPIITSATKPKFLSHQETSPYKRRRLIAVELKSSCGILSKSSKFHYSDNPINDNDISEDIVSPTKRHRHKKRNENSQILESPGINKESSQKSLKNRCTRKLRIKKYRNVKDKALELMRRRRAGENIDKLTSSESNSSNEDVDDELEILSVFEDDDEDEDIEKADLSSSGGVENGMHANDSDFIVDDGDDTLGVPNHMTFIPLHLTHTAHKPLKEHFRDAVEWLIKNKICLEFARDDEIYLQAFRKLDDICLGLAKSKFISTQWTPAFTRAIWTRPYIICGPIMDGEGYELKTGLPKCDACNHRKHVPISFIQFQGQAYDKLTLVEIDQQSESEQESSENNDLNEFGDCHQRTKQWFVGRTCKKNAQYSHSLIHWKFALNEWVIDALSHEGYLSSSMIAERKAMEPKQLDQYTNKLIDSWETKGLIKILYQDWKNQRNLAIAGLRE